VVNYNRFGRVATVRYPATSQNGGAGAEAGDEVGTSDSDVAGGYAQTAEEESVAQRVGEALHSGDGREDSSTRSAGNGIECATESAAEGAGGALTGERTGDVSEAHPGDGAENVCGASGRGGAGAVRKTWPGCSAEDACGEPAEIGVGGVRRAQAAGGAEEAEVAGKAGREQDATGTGGSCGDGGAAGLVWVAGTGGSCGDGWAAGLVWVAGTGGSCGDGGAAGLVWVGTVAVGSAVEPGTVPELAIGSTSLARWAASSSSITRAMWSSWSAGIFSMKISP
jgi:hypothetical protein